MGIEPGAWHVDQVYLYDVNGNRRSYSNNGDILAAINVTATALTVNVTSPGVDDEAPILKALSIEPQEINVTQSSSDVTVRLQAEDLQAGIGYVDLYFKSPSGEDLIYCYIGRSN